MRKLYAFVGSVADGKGVVFTTSLIACTYICVKKEKT